MYAYVVALKTFHASWACTTLLRNLLAEQLSSQSGQAVSVLQYMSRENGVDATFMEPLTCLVIGFAVYLVNSEIKDISKLQKLTFSKQG